MDPLDTLDTLDTHKSSPFVVKNTVIEAVAEPLRDLTQLVECPKHNTFKQLIRQHTWFTATMNVLPVYSAVHLAFVITTALSFLFMHKDFDGSWLPLQSLPGLWHHWDTGYYLMIARYGYQGSLQTAFFPLYGLLERMLMPFTGDPLIAGFIISDVAGLLLLVVLFQLVREDFGDEERARRTILYLSLFPTAFFLASGYNESLFICLSLLSFYQMRHGNWWLAGIFGFFASLTRSTGLFLLLPFCYEYLAQHKFHVKRIRLNVISGVFIPAGIAAFSLYCYLHFHDFLAFSHAQAHWNHQLQPPWYGILGSLNAIFLSHSVVSFQALRNLLDLVPDLLVLALIVLSFIGPLRLLRLPRQLWSYGLYAATLWLFLQLFPVGGTGLYPLQSTSRYLLEIFPAFIMLAAFGKSRTFNMHYLVISGALLFFLLTQFLTGHWVL